MEIFEPTRINQEYKYAVAIPCEEGFLSVIEKCPTTEQLETAYKNWFNYASQKHLCKPLPIELLDSSGKCKILEEMIIDPQRN